MESPSERGDQVAAQMIHQSVLATWLVRSIGRAVVALLAPPVVGGVVASVTGEEAWIGMGALVGVLAFVLSLVNATAPMPSAEVFELLGREEDEA